MNRKLRSFYIDVMNCERNKNECPQAMKDFSIGLVPRAFNPCKSNIADILVVAKNPGHPLKGETDFYKGKRGESLLNAKDEWDSERCSRMQATKDNSLKYHKNLRRYLRYFLGLSQELETYEEYQKNCAPAHEKQISQYVAFTNLFKCSTKCEQERIKDTSFSTCYRQFFVEELELIRPRAILALGNEVSHFLQRQQLEIRIVTIRHPSYFYKMTNERSILKVKKDELTNIRKP